MKFDKFLLSFEKYLAKYEEESKNEQPLTVEIDKIIEKIKKGQTEWTLKDLEKIVVWKRLQRELHRIRKNDAEDVREILTAAFKIQNEKARIRLLKTINGVGPSIISAILMFYDKEQYGVLDFHAWNALHAFNKDLILWGITNWRLPLKKAGIFNLSELFLYLDIIRRIAQIKNTAARNVDKALFTYDAFGKI